MRATYESNQSAKSSEQESIIWIYHNEKDSVKASAVAEKMVTFGYVIAYVEANEMVMLCGDGDWTIAQMRGDYREAKLQVKADAEKAKNTAKDRIIHVDMERVNPYKLVAFIQNLGLGRVWFSSVYTASITLFGFTDEAYSKVKNDSVVQTFFNSGVCTEHLNN